jgi:pyridoxamine 5'-phosphate oxidase
LGAVASKQSSKIASRKQLQDARDQLDKELEGQPVPLPENWGGYQLTPTKVEFWQGRLDRLHDRVVYEREGQTWRRSRISP